MSRFVSQSEFAREIGVSRQYVSKLVKEGVIELVSGKIDSEKAKEILRARREPARHSKADLTPSKPLDDMTAEELRALRDALMDDGDSDSAPSSPGSLADYRTKYEKERSLIIEMERKTLEGTLVNIHQVEAHFHDIFATLQQTLRSLPGSMVSVVRSAKSDREAYVALRDEIDDALRDLADSFSDRYGVVEEDNT